MMPRGLRNKNPGNIVKSSLPFVGKVAGDDDRFETFATMVDGLRACAELLLRYYRRDGINTVEAAIGKWAPPTENDTTAYVARVAAGLGVHRLTPIDFTDPQILRGLVAAIGRFENGAAAFDAECTAAMLDAAIAAALQTRPQDVVAESQPTVPETPPASATPPVAIPVPQPAKEPAMGAGLIVGLVQSLLGAFAPQAQAQLAPIINALAPAVAGAAPLPPAGVVPASQDALLQFVQGIMQTALQISGHPAPATATDADKIAATAKVLADPALVTAVQDDAVARLDHLAPILDKLAAADAAVNAASIAGKTAAMTRQQGGDPGIVRLVVKDISDTKKAIIGGIALAVIVAAVCKGLFPDMPDYVTTLIALGGPLFGSAMKESGAVVSYYFDGTPAQNEANAINAELAKKQ